MSDKGEKTRNTILDSASRLFYRQGYANTSFSDIVSAAGVYRGNIYHYFKSKEAILKAVVTLEIAKIDTLLAGWDTHYPDPRDRLGQFVRMFAMNRRELMRSGCPFGTLNSELGKNRRDLQRISKKLLDRFQDWLETQFRALGHTQEARMLALHVLARTQGMSVIAHVYSDSSVIEHEVCGLERWIDSIGQPSSPVPNRVRGQERS